MSKTQMPLKDALETLSHPDQLVRLTLTQDVVERWPDQDALDVIAQGLLDRRRRVQREAARMVGQLWCRRAELREALRQFGPSLCALITESVNAGRVQKAASWSLGWLERNLNWSET